MTGNDPIVGRNEAMEDHTQRNNFGFAAILDFRPRRFYRPKSVSGLRWSGFSAGVLQDKHRSRMKHMHWLDIMITAFCADPSAEFVASPWEVKPVGLILADLLVDSSGFQLGRQLIAFFISKFSLWTKFLNFQLFLKFNFELQFEQRIVLFLKIKQRLATP